MLNEMRTLQQLAITSTIPSVEATPVPADSDMRVLRNLSEYVFLFRMSLERRGYTLVYNAAFNVLWLRHIRRRNERSFIDSMEFNAAAVKNRYCLFRLMIAQGDDGTVMNRYLNHIEQFGEPTLFRNDVTPPGELN